MEIREYHNARNKRIRELKEIKKFSNRRIAKTLGIEIRLVKIVLHETLKVKKPKKQGDRFYDVRMKEWM